MTAAAIIDTIYPLTKEDMKCGFKKARKMRARAELVLLIDDYLHGLPVELPIEVKQLLEN